MIPGYEVINFIQKMCVREGSFTWVSYHTVYVLNNAHVHNNFSRWALFKFHLKPICNQLVSVDMGKSSTINVFCDLLSTSAK